jgi:4'-phosphopantetheinyl transferase
MSVPRLEPGEVHVWRVQPKADGGGAALRAILAGYLGADPAEIQLTAGRGGKPRLERGSDGGWLRFNLSHTRGRALLAVARDREVGIDVERIAPGRAISTIADELFSARESALLRSLPLHARTAAFFRLWTRKEAVLKALGTGLGLGPALDEIEVLSPDVPAGGLAWALRDLPAGPGYAAALASEGVVEPGVRFVARPGPRDAIEGSASPREADAPAAARSPRAARARWLCSRFQASPSSPTVRSSPSGTKIGS